MAEQDIMERMISLHDQCMYNLWSIVAHPDDCPVLSNTEVAYSVIAKLYNEYDLDCLPECRKNSIMFIYNTLSVVYKIDVDPRMMSVLVQYISNVCSINSYLMYDSGMEKISDMQQFSELMKSFEETGKQLAVYNGTKLYTIVGRHWILDVVARGDVFVKKCLYVAINQ